MQFCPKCKSIMLPEQELIKCRACGFVTERGTSAEQSPSTPQTPKRDAGFRRGARRRQTNNKSAMSRMWMRHSLLVVATIEGC